MTRKAILHCCVRGCKNTAQPGSKSCGKHGKRKASPSNGHRARFVHLDSRVAHLLVALEPLDAPADVQIEVRDNGVIVGLPTTLENMVAFLGDWLARPGNTLAVIERLTQATLRPAPLMANAYAHAADALVRYDLGGGA